MLGNLLLGLKFFFLLLLWGLGGDLLYVYFIGLKFEFGSLYSFDLGLRDFNQKLGVIGCPFSFINLDK